MCIPEDVTKLHDKVFSDHGCTVVPREVLSKVGWFDLADIRQSNYFRNNALYLKPTNTFMNHVLWGSEYAHDTYCIAGKSLEDQVEEKLNESSSPIYISGLGNDDLVIKASKFSFLLSNIFLQRAGFIEDFFVVVPEKRLLFFRDNDIEYALYCRDPDLHPQPFNGVDDEMIVRAFEADKEDFVNGAIDQVRLPHLETEILPFTLEKKCW